MKSVEKHYVVFHSPGTFFDETSRRNIDSWDTKEAIKISRTISERYDASPFGFVFVTLLEADPIKDDSGNEFNVQPIKVKESGMHFIGGTVDTYKTISERNLKEDIILRSNMRSNKFWTVVTNTNSYKVVRPFDKDSVILNENGEVIDRPSNYIADWESVDL